MHVVHAVSLVHFAQGETQAEQMYEDELAKVPLGQVDELTHELFNRNKEPFDWRQEVHEVIDTEQVWQGKAQVKH